MAVLDFIEVLGDASSLAYVAVLDLRLLKGSRIYDSGLVKLLGSLDLDLRDAFGRKILVQP